MASGEVLAGPWWWRAACKGLAWDRFISADNTAIPLDAPDEVWAAWDDEPWEPPAEVKALCDPCPVQHECLLAALSFDSYGYWAGTSRHQRRQLRRARRRVACPVCAATLTATVGPFQVCGSCGRSWRRVA